MASVFPYVDSVYLLDFGRCWYHHSSGFLATPSSRTLALALALLCWPVSHSCWCLYSS
jgi:hypothetical protein